MMRNQQYRWMLLGMFGRLIGLLNYILLDRQLNKWLGKDTVHSLWIIWKHLIDIQRSIENRSSK